MSFRIAPTGSNLGQATLEAIGVIGFFLPIFAIAASLLVRHWKRLECGYLTFEATHARVHQRTYPVPSRVQVRFQPTVSGVKGVGRCGAFTSEVEVTHLEGAIW